MKVKKGLTLTENFPLAELLRCDLDGSWFLTPCIIQILIFVLSVWCLSISIVYSVLGGLGDLLMPTITPQSTGGSTTGSAAGSMGTPVTPGGITMAPPPTPPLTKTIGGDLDSSLANLVGGTVQLFLQRRAPFFLFLSETLVKRWFTGSFLCLCRPRHEEEVNSIIDWCFGRNLPKVRFVSDSFFSSFRDPQSEKKLTGGANWTPQVAPTSWGSPGAPMVRRTRCRCLIVNTYAKRLMIAYRRCWWELCVFRLVQPPECQVLRLLQLWCHRWRCSLDLAWWASTCFFF